MKCDECGKESRTGALEALFERCDVCGKSLCLLCQGALADNHGATHLCPTHYKQVVECINIIKGEQKPKIGIGHDDDVYVIATPTNGGWTKATKLSDAEADALYEYIRRERGESDERD